jgi:hypothetical protein
MFNSVPGCAQFLRDFRRHYQIIISTLHIFPHILSLSQLDNGRPISLFFLPGSGFKWDSDNHGH